MKNHYITNNGGHWNGSNFDASREEALMVSRRVAFAVQVNHPTSRIYRVKMRDLAPQVQNDGGKSAAGIKDKNNCTVRALAIAANLPYEFADKIATEAGRKRNKGMQTGDLMSLAATKGVASNRNTCAMTLKRFLQMYPTGRYVCRKAKHAFAVIDGVVHDEGGRMSEKVRLTCFWEIKTYGLPNPTV